MYALKQYDVDCYVFTMSIEYAARPEQHQQHVTQRDCKIASRSYQGGAFLAALVCHQQYIAHVTNAIVDV